MKRVNSLKISITSKSSTPEDLIIIEQKDWKPYTGYLTKANAVKALANYIYGTNYNYYVNCGVEENVVIIEINVYPIYANLVYTPQLSYGILSELVEIVEEDFSEIINFRLSNNGSLSYFNQGIVSYSWFGDCYDNAGNIVKNPEITIENRKIYLSNEVYGSVKINYKVIKHRYIANVPRRDSVSNNFSSVFFCTYLNGITYAELALPDNIEVFEKDPEAKCLGGNQWDSFKNPYNNDESNLERNANRLTVKDYCSQKIISDEIYPY